MMVTRGDGGTWGQGDMVTLGNGDRDKGVMVARVAVVTLGHRGGDSGNDGGTLGDGRGPMVTLGTW